MSEDNPIEAQAVEPEPKPVETKKALTDSVQTFGAIGLLEAVQGEIVLRGRQGERDHLIPLEKAVEKYWHTTELVKRYALYGVRGWDTLAEIADDLRHRILEAASQRRRENRPVPGAVLELEQRMSSEGAASVKNAGATRKDS